MLQITLVDQADLRPGASQPLKLGDQIEKKSFGGSKLEKITKFGVKF
jgi:hypothetical protein